MVVMGMVPNKLILLSLVFLTWGCSDVSIPNPCGMSTKTITWDPPEHWDGNLRVRIYMSKDNKTWTKIKEVTPSTLYDNGISAELDTCGAVYICADQWDDYGHCSREAKCIGQKCEPVKFPSFSCGE